MGEQMRTRRRYRSLIPQAVHEAVALWLYATYCKYTEKVHVLGVTYAE